MADLDWLIELLEGTDTAVAALCLKMARMELQMKIHGITSQELDEFYRLIEGLGSNST
ncbi:hypothetical protein [Microvirga puerhi]|uniref:hypothetical protein n=1 Tax=Microvirga puerhi TaxID=2876078 RepID=UPI001CC9DBF1|nr:hypothetical protein [Microvirga puerhi]